MAIGLAQGEHRRIQLLSCVCQIELRPSLILLIGLQLLQWRVTQRSSKWKFNSLLSRSHVHTQLESERHGVAINARANKIKDRASERETARSSLFKSSQQLFDTWNQPVECRNQVQGNWCEKRSHRCELGIIKFLCLCAVLMNYLWGAQLFAGRFCAARRVNPSRRRWCTSGGSPPPLHLPNGLWQV